jgi:hypothetical protein
MAQNGVAFIAALKQVWVSDTIEEQLYQENELLSLFEKVEPQKEVGNVALVPIHTGRNGGYTAVSKEGSNELNAAGRQEVKQAEYTYTHHWYQVELESAVIDESSGSDLSVAKAADFEMKNALLDLKRQLTRQIVATSGALIAETEINAATTTLKLKVAANELLVRELIFPGLIVSVGTAGAAENSFGKREITEVIPSLTEPKIKISGANVTTAAGEFLSIQGARSGETSFEMNGLPFMVSETTKLGAVNPATVTKWKSNVDTTTTAITLEALMERQDAIMQASSKEADTIVAGVKQYRNYYLELQNQVRFSGDGGIQGGNSGQLLLGINKVIKDPDVLSNNFWFLRKADLMAVRKPGGPVWADQEYGNVNPVQYVQGTTRVKGAIVYRIQLGMTRRNTSGAFTALT